MNNTKVAVIHNLLTPYIIPFFKELVKQKEYQFKFFLTSENKLNREQQKEIDNKFDYLILPKFSINFPDQDEFSYFINPTFLYEIIKYKPDVIIAAGWDTFSYLLSFLYAKIFHKKFILWSGSTKYENNWRRIISRLLVRSLIKYSDALISYGTRAKKYLIQLRAKREKIFIAYNTVDIDFFIKAISLLRKAEPKKQEREIKKKKKTIILYIGQLIERKGIKDLIKAIEILKSKIANIVLLLVGDGIMKSEILNYLKKNQLEDTVRVMGNIKYNSLPEIYHLANIFVLPSREEVWGLVINEAMACGLPVITSNKTGASDDLVKQGENGFIFPARNYHILAQYLKTVIENPILARKMGENSSRLIKSFNNRERARIFYTAINYVLKN